MSATLRAQAIKDALTPHEQQLVLRAAAGKSPAALAAIYRQYEGENDVIATLSRLERKIDAHLDKTGGRTPLERLRHDPRDDATGGIPIKTVPPRNEGTTTARERDAQVEVLLRQKPRSPANIGEMLGIHRHPARKSLERLRKRGIAEPSGETAFDYTRSAKGGSPAAIWRLVGDTRKAQTPPPSEKTPKAARQPPQAAEAKPARKSYPVVDMPSGTNTATSEITRKQILALISDRIHGLEADLHLAREVQRLLREPTS
jgi:DNA-binding CsgD family transcriptional regulator